MFRRKTSASPCAGTGPSSTGSCLFREPFFLDNKGDAMSYLSWIVLGLIAGFIGSKIVNRRGEGILLDILLGVAGAFAGGLLFGVFGSRGVSGLNIYSLFVAVVG